MEFLPTIFSSPSKIAKPKTNSELPKIEPINAAFTIPSKPAFRAKIQINNSGKLPNTGYKIPVAEGPSFLPSWSVACPTTIATKTNATALNKNSKIALRWAWVANPAMAVIITPATIKPFSFFLHQFIL